VSNPNNTKQETEIVRGKRTIITKKGRVNRLAFSEAQKEIQAWKIHATNNKRQHSQ
jgi:hypothetical protein